MASLTQEQRKWLNKCTTINVIKGSWTLNPKTGLVDVEGSFNCSKQGLSDFKGVKFGVVKKHFWCENNLLTSLEGAPQSVGRDFDCSYNRLTSLVGAPQSVGKSFYCYNNRLTSLVGAPQSVGRDFVCSYNRLISLEGAPQRFMSLNGAPQRYCYLFVVEGIDQVRHGCFVGDFDCKGNPVSQKTLYAISSKMKECHSFVIAAASLRNEMSEKDWRLISPNIPEAIQPGVSMLARFGVFR